MKTGLNLPGAVSICDQAVEEGLQAEERFIPTEAKSFLVQGLVNAGFKRIGLGMFSHPRVLPQFRDCEELYRRIPRRPDVTYVTPTFNMRALERAIKAKEEGAGPDIVEVQVSCGEAYAQRVLGISVAEEWKLVEDLVKVARDAGFKVLCEVAGVWTLMGEGKVTPMELPLQYIDRFLAMGADELAYAEDGSVMGKPSPHDVYALFSRILDKYPDPQLHTFHYHDRYGLALANSLAAMQAGIARIDTCLGGGPSRRIASIVDGVPVGGSYGLEPGTDLYVSPYEFGMPPTEDFVVMCASMGVETGIDVDQLFKLGRWMEKIVGRKLRSYCLKADVSRFKIV